MSRIMNHAATRRARQCLAFTLVELLVVIGIIALLISILLPALNRARASAASVACQANMRTIGQTIAMYAVNNKGALPIGYASDWVAANGTTAQYTNWGLLLMNTLDSRLPTNSYDAYTTGPGKMSPNTSKLRSAFFCSEVPGVGVNGASIAVLHYLCHPRLLPDVSAIDKAIPGGLTKYKGWKLSKVKRSAEIAMIFDGSLRPSDTNPDVWAPKYDNPVAYAIDNWAIGYGDFLYRRGTFYPGQPVSMKPGLGSTPNVDFNTDAENNRGNIRFRHMKNKVANVLFADSHVASFNLKSNPASLDAATDMMRNTIYVDETNN